MEEKGPHHDPESLARQAMDLPKYLGELRDIYRRLGERFLGFANALDQQLEPSQRATTIYTTGNLQRLQQENSELYLIVDRAVTTAVSLSTISVEEARAYELKAVKSAFNFSIPASAAAVSDLATTVSANLRMGITIASLPGSMERIQTDPMRAELLAQLERLSQDFRAMLLGSWQTFYSNNPDRFRQAATSIRELLRMVLDRLAPRSVVAQNLGMQKKQQADGSFKSPEAQVTHAMQISAVMHAAPKGIVEDARALGTVLEALERGVYGALNVPLHGDQRIAAQTTHALLQSGEALLSLLLAHTE